MSIQYGDLVQLTKELKPLPDGGAVGVPVDTVGIVIYIGKRGKYALVKWMLPRGRSVQRTAAVTRLLPRQHGTRLVQKHAERDEDS